MMQRKCMRCGRIENGNNAFCTVCGGQIAAYEVGQMYGNLVGSDIAETSQKTKKKSTGKKVFITISLIVLFFIGVIGAFFIGRMYSGDSDNDKSVQAGGDSDKEYSEGYDSPEEAITHFIEGVAQNNMSDAMDACYTYELADNFDAEAMYNRMQSIQPTIDAPAEYDLYREYDRAYELYKWERRAVHFAYGIFAADNEDVANVADGMAVSADEPSIVDAFIKDVNPDKLKDLKIVQIDRVCKDVLKKEQNQKNIKIQLGCYGLDGCEYREYAVLVEYNNKTFMTAYSVVESDGKWKLYSSALYFGGELNCTPIEMSAAEYTEEIAGYQQTDDEGESQDSATEKKADEVDLVSILLNTACASDGTKEVLDYCEADFDNCGEVEAFALVGEEGEVGEYFGTLYFVTASGADPIIEDNSFYAYGEGHNYLEFGKDKFYLIGQYFATGDFTYVYGVKDGTYYEDAISQQGMQLGYNLGCDDLQITCSGYDARTDGTGHTWKHYYMYYDSGFKEYGGIRITEDELLRCNGADEIINQIKEVDGQIKDIFYRENNIININFLCGEDNRNTTLKLEGDTVRQIFVNEGDNPLDRSDYGGIYEEAYLSEIATYPKEFPVK